MSTVENANINIETIRAMKQANDAMKGIHSGMGINKIDDTMYVTRSLLISEILTFLKGRDTRRNCASKGDFRRHHTSTTRRRRRPRRPRRRTGKNGAGSAGQQDAGCSCCAGFGDAEHGVEADGGRRGRGGVAETSGGDGDIEWVYGSGGELMGVIIASFLSSGYWGVLRFWGLLCWWVGWDSFVGGHVSVVMI